MEAGSLMDVRGGGGFCYRRPWFPLELWGLRGGEDCPLSSLPKVEQGVSPCLRSHGGRQGIAGGLKMLLSPHLPYY